MGNWRETATAAVGRLRPSQQAVDAAWAAGRRVVRGYTYAPTRWVVGVAAGTGLVLAVGAIAATGPWQGGQRVQERELASGGVRQHSVAKGPARPAGPSWHGPAAVLQPAGVLLDAPAGTLPTRAGLSSALLAALSDTALGRVTASVVDVGNGQVLYSSGADQPQQPASTNKIATATAALSLLGPDHRFTTKVVGDGHGGLVLVGGGDPTLTAAGAGPNSVAALAAATAKALKAPAAAGAGGTGGTGTPRPTSASVSLRYDISLFAGPALHPIGVNGNIALVQALTTDEGRVDPHSTDEAQRYSDPAQHAAQQFATALAAQGVTVTGAPSQGSAPAGATTLAQVQSAPLSDIVERMLTNSDNDIAEGLGHACALATARVATFATGATAVRETLTRLGIKLGGTRLADSSGLSEQDEIPADVLTQLLVLDAAQDHPELRAVLSGLPIAGFTGTLDNRYGGAGSAAGLGVVRAKTGTLRTVNTLAGLVVDRSGRLLAFAFMSNGSGNVNAARAALDRLAAKVADCGCTT